MTPVGLGVLVAAAIGFVVLAIASAVVGLTWHLLATKLDGLTRQRHADTLAALRLLPATLSLMTTVLVFVAFIRLEPEQAREVPGWILSLLAASGAGLVIYRVVAGVRAWQATARVVRSWSSSPIPREDRLAVATIDTPFPIVAVVGIVRPRLYIARTVVDSCDASELDAVIAHESAHLRARDNLTRLLFLCAPVVLGRTFKAIEAEWIRVSEEAADDRARTSLDASLALASALIKVARIAQHQPAPLLHASAILSGSVVEARVRRLLASAPAPDRGSFVRVSVCGALSALAASAAFAQPLLYEAAEFCVRHLP